jgi:hypothetical protein
MKTTPPQTPGVYPGSGKASLLRANEQQWLFQQQLVTAGQASIAVQLERIKSSFYPFGASLQIYFTNSAGSPVTPGAFEVDMQTSDIDADAQYCTLSSLTGGLNASYAGRIENSLIWAKFLRAYIPTLTNAVYVSVLVTR